MPVPNHNLPFLKANFDFLSLFYPAPTIHRFAKLARPSREACLDGPCSFSVFPLAKLNRDNNFVVLKAHYFNAKRVEL